MGDNFVSFENMIRILTQNEPVKDVYAKLVISVCQVRQGKFQTASCRAHASTSCSGDMFNAKSMPKSDQNLGVWMWWLLQSYPGHH